ncbi:LamG domain-containing protein [Streptomyces melanogenes]|uniref:LamG domain-containing protein n=1 Tax=Streptomyces melanogenes TaxID=67326 RepID=UPI003797A71C
MNQRKAVVRWSLIGLIAVLAVSLTFVLIAMNGDSAAKAEPPAATPAGKKADSRVERAPAPPALRGVGWWPAHEKAGATAADLVGPHRATLRPGAGWTDSPFGGALLFNGSTGFADTGAPILDTAKADYSVAARVRLDADGFRTAVSLDGRQASVFFLQYVPDFHRFSFSFVNARAVANGTQPPKFGTWYHLVGTYTHADKKLRIFVNGALAGEVLADNPEQPAGSLVIGRGKFQGKATDFWPGAVSDVHAYHRALTPAEAAALAKREPAK